MEGCALLFNGPVAVVDVVVVIGLVLLTKFSVFDCRLVTLFEEREIILVLV